MERQMITYDPHLVARPTHRRPAQKRSVDWISGLFPSAKEAMDNKMTRWDGMLSYKLILLLENDPSVISYFEKPLSVRWTDGARWRTYTPKFSIHLADGRKICVEVRATKRVEKTRFLAAFPHIRRAILKGGFDEFELWTEKHIEIQPQLANAELIASERSFVTNAETEHLTLKALLQLGGSAKVRDLRRASGVGQGSFRAVVRLVAAGHARLARPDLVFDDSAVVEIPQK
jgi:hypothetical protein